MRLAFDTGATISYTQVVKHGFKINKSTIKIKAADGKIKEITGVTEPLRINVADKIVELSLAVIVNNSSEVLLGVDWFEVSKA